MIIEEIKKILNSSDKLDPSFEATLLADNRIGVKNIYRQYLLRKEAEAAELQRLKNLYQLERTGIYKDKLICGIDEVGRGPLAGPVYAAAVILDKDTKYIMGLNDSKKLTFEKRAKLGEEIKEASIAWAIAFATVEEIDALNILQATYLAMLRAYNSLSLRTKYIFVDGPSFPKGNYQVETIIDGDAKCACIAAASILAKNARDTLMIEFDKEYAEYNFASNKGYGTKEHCLAIKKYGLTPLHRKEFIKNII